MSTQYTLNARIERLVSASIIAVSMLGSLSAQSSEVPCAVSSDTKLPFFGDLHIHTRYSFDSFLSNQKNDPEAPMNTPRVTSSHSPMPTGSRPYLPKSIALSTLQPSPITVSS